MGQHFARLQSRMADGKLVLAGRTVGPNPTGVVLLEADSKAEARAFVENDPALRVCSADLRPFNLTLLRR